MRGYEPTSYGDAFADVYDEWYQRISDVGATVRVISDLVADRAEADAQARVLELGVGTGRLAIPLAAAGHEVTGIDTSEAMLARLRDQDATDSVTALRGDMVDDLPDGPFDVALIAYNTFFNLLDADRQLACFGAVARRLRSAGRFVVEAFVPDPDAAPAASGDVSVRSIAADRVVLSVSRSQPAAQRIDGQFVEITEANGIRLRPWAIRWAGVDELDAMAATAGFAVEHRWADMSRHAFDDDSTGHVTVYRLGGPSSA